MKCPTSPPPRSILDEHSGWHKHCWRELDTGELLQGVEQQQQRVAGLAEKVVGDWDLYQHLTQAVDTVRLSVPMLEGLKRYAVKSHCFCSILACVHMYVVPPCVLVTGSRCSATPARSRT